MLFAFYTYRFDSIRFGRARKNRMLDFQIRWKWTSRNLLRLTFFFFSFYIFIYIAARLPYAICSTITTNVRFDGSRGKQISIKLFSAPKYADEIINTECCELSWKRRKKWRWAGKKIESICKEKESHELEMSIFDRVYKTVCGKPSEREKLCKLSLSYSICFSVTFSNSKKLVRSVSQSFWVCICVSLSVSLFLRGSLFSANSLSSSFVAPNVVNEKKLVWNSFFTPKSTYDWYKT